MKKDNLLIVRLVSVGALLATLALIALLGVRHNLFTSISDKITDGYITSASGSYPLCTAQYYYGLDAVYGVLFAILVYASVLSVVGIFLKAKGSPLLAFVSAVAGIVMGVFLVLSKIFEKNAAINRLFSKIYLGDWGSFEKAVDGVSAIPVRAVVFGILLIILSVLLLYMLKQSMLLKAKMYYSSDPLIWFGFLVPVIYSELYIDTIRGTLMASAFVHNSLSDQIFGILDGYYLKSIFFISGNKLYGVAGFAIIATILYKLGIKRRMVQYILPAFSGVMSLIGIIVFLVNQPALFGYVTLDDTVCDKVEAVGLAALLMMATDMVFITALTAMCLDTSIKASNIKILIITGISVIISVIAILSGLVLPIMFVYIALIIVNILSLAALFKFTYVSGSHH